MRNFWKGLIMTGLAALLATSPALAAETGLWVGQVDIDQVTNISTPASAKKTGAPMSFKVILHQGSDGTVKLLKSVVVMWQDGTTNADGSINVPGHYALVSDPARIPDFKGVALRDNQTVGRRISTVNYDFTGTELACGGSIAESGSVTCTLTVGADLPTNPFLHRYHPQHDNLNSTYSGAATTSEVLAVSRALTLTFTAPTPKPPAWGSALLGGSYAETLTGLNNTPLEVAGTFTLSRVSKTGVLNK